MGDAYDYGEYQQRDFSVPLKRTPVHVLTDKRLNALVAQRCAPLVEALERIQEIAESPAMAGRYARIHIISEAREALAAHRAQEKAGGAEAAT